MKRYRQDIDSVIFSQSFERDTIELMRLAAHKKEEKSLNTRKVFKIAIAVVVITALLTGTAFAISSLLSASQVAQRLGEDAIARAFESEDAVIIDETKQAGDYIITLHGIVSGAGFEEINGDIDVERSYIVISMAYADGRSIESAEGNPLMLTPVIDGLEPWRVNVFSLSAGASTTYVDGVAYSLYAMDDIVMFADRRVRIFGYEGLAPSREVFSMREDGVIEYSE
ncbi:MAG: hypothetical protein IJC18_02725, partial [Clostridia bacterium]|nr:hypothetical protein [Clostridia bacterium]